MRAGRAMLSAVVIRKGEDSKLGSGFFMPVPTGFYSACGTQLEFLFEKEISILIE